MQCNFFKLRASSVGSFRLVTRRGEDATQVRWRFVESVRTLHIKSCNRENYTPISFDAIHSVCALPEPGKNKELFNLLYTVNEETRGCLKKECDNLRWNNYCPRCRRCFSPGLCYSCTIPSIYQSEQVQWEGRCFICHTKKQHRSYYLTVCLTL